MKDRLSIKSKYLTLVLLSSIAIIILLIALIQPGKHLGMLFSFPLKYLFGRFYGAAILILIFAITNNAFSKVSSKVRKNIFIALFVILTGLVMLFSLNMTKNDDSYLKGLINSYNYSIKESYNYSFIDLLIKSDLNGGFIGKILFALIAEVIGKIGSIVVSSLVLGLGICMLCNFIYKERSLYNRPKEKKEKIIRQDHEKYNFEYENKNKINQDPFNLNIKLDEYDEKKTNPTNIIQKETSSKLFNVFTDEVISEEELAIDRINRSNNPNEKFNVFEDDLVKQNSRNDTFDKFNIPLKEENIVSINEDITEEIEVTNDNNVSNEPTSFYEDESLDFDGVDYDNFDDTYYEEENNQASLQNNIDIRSNSSTIDEVFSNNDTSYSLPSSSLLLDRVADDISINQIEAEKNARIIDEKLKFLNIDGKVHNYIIAPSFTRFQISVAGNVKINAIPNVDKDIMMALSAPKINVLAPIPATNFVGIDVPNNVRSMVTFKECMTSIPYDKKDDKLLFNVGKDVSGNFITVSLSECPHLLVAGATGSGKSVCLNSIIMSLIMRSYPSEVEMLLIDLKQVEFQPYASIPHLICPVVNDAQKAVVALRKVCEEMDKRYSLLNKYSKKDIKLYNRYMEQTGGQKMPYLVVIIDELADLMMQVKNEVEESIIRLAGKARAAGIHLILATQRPSVDVITGIIKSNVPSRIAFSVPSNTDSRVILDDSGAEDLLGKGDMILKISGRLNKERVQGCFLDDVEIDNVNNYLRSCSTQHFNDEFLDLSTPVQGSINFGNLSGDDESRDDEIYDNILDLLVNTNYVSNTWLKRKLAIGYSTAARMIDRLESDGLIGPANNNKPRVVYTDLVRGYERKTNDK